MKLQKYLIKQYTKGLSEIKENVIQDWINIDNKIFKQKKSHFVVKDFREKTIWTPYTDLIKYKRRRYYDKKHKTYRYLLDEHLGIDKYKFICKCFQKLAILHFDKFRSYISIAKIIYNDRVTKTTIHNFLKNHEVKFSIDNFVCCNDGILWINADGMRIKKNKRKKAFEVKNLALFTGRKLDEYKKKWKLEGRTMCHFIIATLEEIANKLQEIILQYDGMREIRMVGDGAKWIKNLAKRIGATFYIDKFHYSKAINDLVGRHPKVKAQIYEFIHNEIPVREFQKNLRMISANLHHGEITKKSKSLIGYLTNNYFNYIRNANYDNPINCIEGLQSHYQGRFFKNQRKGWSVKVLNNLINFTYSRLNGGSALDIDIGPKINYPLFSDYGIRASVPGIEDPKLAATLNKVWK